MKTFIYEAWKITSEMSPYLLIGFFIAALLKYFISDASIKKIAGKNNLASDIKLSLFGIPLPLCSCGVIPTGISLYKSGASKSATTAFFISTPQTGVDSIAVTYSLINLPFAIMRPIVAFFTSILGGFFVRLFNSDEIKNEAVTPEKVEVKSEKVNFVGAIKYAFIDFLDDISKWLVVGIFLAALITIAIPDDFFTNYIGNQFVEMIMILAVSIPLYVCATGSVPIAAALLLKGLSPGAALVFLMAGPATNMATITLVKKVLGTRTLLAYISSITLGALFFGILINNFLPAQWFSFHPGAHQHSHMLPQWLEISSTLIFLSLLISSLYRKISSYFQFRKSKQNAIKQENNMETNFKNFKIMSDKTLVKIDGMTCNHCKMNVEKAIKSVEGIKDVHIDLTSGTAELEGDNFSLENVKKAVDDIGYSFLGKTV
jgi:uncharacterized membrane protein YraQ (UPF0718 family)/copper chaperone CopZ